MNKLVNTGSENISWGPEVAVDFESYYLKNKHDIETLGAWHYNRHEKSYPYLVAVSDGVTLWVGNPKDFFWVGLQGRTLISHNQSFDGDVYEAGVERGAWPRVTFKAWYCTADMSAWLCGARSLQNAVKKLLGEDISKQVRADMNGKTWEDMLAEVVILPDGKQTTFAQQVVDYAGDDTICLRLWQQFNHKWPEQEKWLSCYNIERGRKGVCIDIPELERCTHLARHVIAESTELLPWVKRGRKQGSPIGIAEECRMSNIPNPPVKTGPKGDPELAEEWLESYAAKLPWVKALKELRSAKKMLATLETMQERLRPDGTLAVPLLYCGTHTTRFAATGGLNFLNLNKEPLFTSWDAAKRGIDIRGLLIPRKGKKFAIIDLSQIEPRVLNWIVGNEALLSKVREGMAIYEAFARTSSGWTGGNLKKADKKKYALAKANVLALGYGAGWKKFIIMALMPMYGNLDLCAEDDTVAMQLSLDKKFYVEEKHDNDGKVIFVTVDYDKLKHGTSDKVLRSRFIIIQDPETKLAVRENVYGVNARVIVAHFRKTNPLIAGETGIWKTIDNILRESAKNNEDAIVEIAGFKMVWRNCRMEKRRKIDKETGEAYTKNEVRYEQGHKVESTYGAAATENVCQFMARHVFMHCLRRAIVEGGLWCPLDVYDEAMLEVEDDGTPLFVEVEGQQRRFMLETPNDSCALGRAMKYFAEAPAWADGLPVACEGQWSDRYLK